VTLAHIAGIPIEETLPSLAVALLASGAWLTTRLRRRGCSSLSAEGFGKSVRVGDGHGQRGMSGPTETTRDFVPEVHANAGGGVRSERQPVVRE
jgi:hypothetical protein